MKVANKVMILMGLLAAPALWASSFNEQAYVAGYHGRSDIPVPVSVVTPQVREEYAGTTVNVTLTVESDGKPADIQVMGAPDMVLESQVAAAMAKWRFAPAKRDGQSVAVKVEVPIRIVASGDTPLLASN